MSAVGYLQKFASIAAWDLLQNRLYTTSRKRFLVTRHPGEKPLFYQTYLDWLAHNFPDIRAHFELHLLPTRLYLKRNYALHIPWLQDPVEAWSPRAYRQSVALMSDCDRLKIPVVNRVDQLLNASKSSAPDAIKRAVPVFRTPKTLRITDPQEFKRTRSGLSLPVMVREDRGHQKPIIRIDTEDELRSISIEGLKMPVASEIIDVQSPDGLFRKYRYVVAGKIGVPLSMHLCKTWIARGNCALYNEQMLSEEKEYTLVPCPHHSSFVKAAEALGLDLIAFDYSLDHAGMPVIWEANPYPFFHFPSGELRRIYGGEATVRVFAAMTCLYLQKAGIKPHKELETLLKIQPRLRA